MGGAYYGGVGFWAGADRKAGPVATENGVSEQHLAIVRQPVLSPFPNYIVHTGHWYASLFFFLEVVLGELTLKLGLYQFEIDEKY